MTGAKIRNYHKDSTTEIAFFHDLSFIKALFVVVLLTAKSNYLQLID